MALERERQKSLDAQARADYFEAANSFLRVRVQVAEAALKEDVQKSTDAHRRAGYFEALFNHQKKSAEYRERYFEAKISGLRDDINKSQCENDTLRAHLDKQTDFAEGLRIKLERAQSEVDGLNNSLHKQAELYTKEKRENMLLRGSVKVFWFLVASLLVKHFLQWHYGQIEIRTENIPEL